MKAIKSLILAGMLFHNSVSGQVKVILDPAKEYQVIDNFAASDAWSGQFVGTWPAAKRNAIADLLFSTGNFPDGSPKGIGLSMWRYNIGAGSREQGRESGIKDEWRRAGNLLGKDGKYNWQDVAGQVWLLQAAKERGVKQFLGFLNSPPVHLTSNGKAFASQAQCNIDQEKYDALGDYVAGVVKGIRSRTGITLDYVSPVNEPQWDWSDGGQEGNPYNNGQVAGVVRSLSASLLANRLPTRILIPEAGHVKYLLADEDKPGKGNQVNAFFNPASPAYTGNLSNVSKTVAAHSYFSTSPLSSGIEIRQAIARRMAEIKGLKYWQSEYCILGDNNGEINGEKRDTGMNAALYVARTIHTDLTVANAAAWQWWLAISPYNYKDGLIYIDKGKEDGNFYDSKMLWALGNYSRFVRPGMKRIEVGFDTPVNCMVSAFKQEKDKRIVMVLINAEPVAKKFILPKRVLEMYVTSADSKLKKHKIPAGPVEIEPASITTIITGY